MKRAPLDEDAQAADLLQEYEAKIAALERMVGPQFAAADCPIVAKIAKPTESKLVKGQAESGEICSVEVEEK
jgi:hypothetical protein